MSENQLYRARKTKYPFLYEVWEEGRDQPLDVGESNGPLADIGETILLGQEGYRVVDVTHAMFVPTRGAPSAYLTDSADILAASALHGQLGDLLRLKVEHLPEDRPDVALHGSLWSWKLTADLIHLLKDGGISLAEDDDVVVEAGPNRGQHLRAKLILTRELPDAFRAAEAYSSSVLFFDTDKVSATYYRTVFAEPEEIALDHASDIVEGVAVAGQPLGVLPRDYLKRQRVLGDPHALFDIVVLLLEHTRVRLPDPPSLVVADSRAYHDDLFRRLSADFTRVHQLTSRQWEEIVAEMLDRDGWEVHLTKKTRDGGIDILAAKYERFGKVVHGYECKRYGAANPVRVGIIREFATALRNRGIGIGVLCATSSFTADAVAEAEMNLIYPQDANAMHAWVSDLARRA